MLTIADLTFRMEGRLLFEGASAFVPDGHRVGFVGRNGTGKTTLFRLIAGDLQPEGGIITRPKGARLGLVRQEAPAGPQSLLDTVLAANVERIQLLEEAETADDPHRIAEIQTRLADMGAHAAPARAAEILAGLGFSHEAQQRPCSRILRRLAHARGAGGDPLCRARSAAARRADELSRSRRHALARDYLAHLSATPCCWSATTATCSIARSINPPSRARQAVALHRRLRHVRETRAQKLRSQEAMRRKQETARKHMQSFVDRFRYKASKARQAQSRIKALERMKPIAAVIEERVKPFLLPSPPQPLAPPIIAMEGVEVGYGDGPPVLSHLTLRIDDDDRIALLGNNGNGKSTLAKLLAAALEARGTGRSLARESS